MRKTLMVASAAFLALSATGAYAQDAVIIQERQPDAVVVDPSVTSSTVVVPGEVRTYVMEQQAPSVVYDGPVVVGEPIPEAVELHRVDGHDGYAYSVVNERRVIVNPETRSVIQVLD
jgi:hypothetical protein